MHVNEEDKKHMGSYMYRYRTILTRASSLLKKSAKLRLPGSTKDMGEGSGFERWVGEYNHAMMVLKYCRKEFQKQTWRGTYFVERQSVFFSQNIYFAENRGKKDTNPVMWFRCRDFTNNDQHAIIEFWKSGIRNQEQRFLGDIIDDFVKVIADKAPEDPSLITFQFTMEEINPWVQFYNNQQSKNAFYDFPELPVKCQPWNQSGDDSIFQSFQALWPDTLRIKNPGRSTDQNAATGRSTDQNAAGSNEEYSRRKWVETRACLAFQKAVRSIVLESEKREKYMIYNHITNDGVKCFVLGMSMSNPL